MNAHAMQLEPRAGRVPPADLDAEAAVLSACFLDAPSVDIVCDILVPLDMYAGANQKILEAVGALRQKGKPADMVQVAGLLRDNGRLDQVGGTPYLAQLADATPAIAHVEDHAKRVKEKSRLRAMISTCQKIAAEGYGDIGDAEAWLGSAEQAVFDAASVGPGIDAIEPASAIVQRVVDEFTARQRGLISTTPGIFAGSPRLTRFLSGYQRAQPYVIAARPGMGKSAKALGDSIELAKTGELSIYLSAEMPKHDLIYRALGYLARVDSRKIKGGKMDREEWGRVLAAASVIKKLPWWLCFRPGASIPQIRGDVRRAHSEARKRFGASLKLGMVVVDYIQILNGERKPGDSRESEVAGLSRNLMWLAGETGATVLVLSQLNRALETRPDKRPTLSDLRESGALEQDAYGILFLYRDEYYNRDSPEKGIAEVIVAKHRDFPLGTVKQRFTPQYTRFDDLPEKLADDDLTAMEIRNHDANAYQYPAEEV